MGKFYRDVHAAAQAAKATNETNRGNRAKAKAVDDAIQAAILSLAGKGRFVCLLRADEELAETDTIRVANLKIDRLDVIDCAPELLEAIAARLVKPYDFLVEHHSLGVKRVSWEKPEDATSPAPTPPAPPAQ